MRTLRAQAAAKSVAARRKRWSRRTDSWRRAVLGAPEGVEGEGESRGRPSASGMVMRVKMKMPKLERMMSAA